MNNFPAFNQAINLALDPMHVQSTVSLGFGEDAIGMRGFMVLRPFWQDKRINLAVSGGWEMVDEELSDDELEEWALAYTRAGFANEAWKAFELVPSSCRVRLVEHFGPTVADLPNAVNFVISTHRPTARKVAALRKMG